MLSEDPHWNPSNMIYGDSPIKNSYYRDALGLNSYVPNIAAIMQSGNLYACCGNNPIMYVDPTGEAWWHWAIAATVVVVAAVAVVATCGGATPALVALMSVSYGFTATTLTSTVVASAFIGSSLVFAYIALDAATSSKSMKEFNEKGNWGTVAFTVGGLLVGGANGYTLYKSSFQIAGKGSTGRVEANNAKEVNAMKQIMTDPLKGAKQLDFQMNDPRWSASDGWVKMARNVDGVEIHFNYNTKTGQFDDFKFK